ncbi:MFS transporter (plasmid) [Peribacillus psychrosaccharolyticus]|uniref:MFS transporter n=1 Tax=Peribacillus psychrosaccharolyticus TaxID=1407 RepID=A0A974NIH6_PERPY|nr:MFS transporter [Peribacillus psychrosaccharolyticus]MEC2054230.1 MFS transporter [Peribacillus psychrosaccharolyticus]MED3746581.1 MFS transporter [Peribacillus psychrosaccharolyticus]QQS98414.1 MFS transporter [Peribacillus psychrosaccharolyticus]
MKFKDLHPNVRLRVFEAFFSDTISGIIFPFMAIYFSQNLGAGLAGILLSINIFIGIIASFYGGYLADKIGRKRLWAISEFIRFFSALIIAIANGFDFSSNHTAALITIGMFLINNICMGFSGPAAGAMLIDVSTKENRNFMYSVTFWANNLAAALGSLLGGFLFKDYLPQLFVLLAIAYFISAIIVTFFISETYIAKTEDTINKINILKDIFQKYSVVFKDRTFLLFTLGYLLILSLEFQLPNYIAIKLSQTMPEQNLLPFLGFKIDGINILGLLRAENTIIVIFCMFLVSKIVKNLKDKHVWLTGFIFFSLGYIVLSYSNNAYILILFMVLASVGELMYYAPHKTYLSVLPPEHLRSSYLAVNDLVIRLSFLIAYICIYLSSILSHILMTLIFIAMAILGLIILSSILPLLEKKVIKANENIA